MTRARLYQFVTSPFCAKVRKILEYKGAEFEVIEVDYLERRELLIASGQLTVPALTLDSAETIVGSDRIAMKLEELHPEPTILSPGSRGLHLAMTRYVDAEVTEAIFRAKLPDTIEHWRSRGADRLAMWRYIRERKYGDGFCDRMTTIEEREANRNHARELLAPFDEALNNRAFLFGRIGLADFALYGQLYKLNLPGEVRILDEFPRLHAFFGRVDRISAAIEPA